MTGATETMRGSISFNRSSQSPHWQSRRPRLQAILPAVGRPFYHGPQLVTRQAALPELHRVNPDKRTVFRIDDVKMRRRMFIRKELYLHSFNDSDREHLVSWRRNSMLETSN